MRDFEKDNTRIIPGRIPGFFCFLVRFFVDYGVESKGGEKELVPKYPVYRLVTAAHIPGRNESFFTKNMLHLDIAELFFGMNVDDSLTRFTFFNSVFWHDLNSFNHFRFSLEIFNFLSSIFRNHIDTLKKRG